MSYTKVQIVSLAIERLGQAAISSIDNKLSETAERFYDLLLETDISVGIPSFATKWAELTLNVGTPITPYYQFIFELPGDYIRITDTYPRVDYDILEDRQLYSNVNVMKIKYVYLPQPTQLPAYYVNYIAWRIAEEIAMSVLQNSALAESLRLKAVLAKNQAASLNSQDKPNPFAKTRRYLDARY
jgi:hypothetical protein